VKVDRRRTTNAELWRKPASGQAKDSLPSLWAPNYFWSVRRIVNQEFSVDISEEGIQSADSTDRGQWPRFSNYSESKNPFVICQADSIHVIVPKRAFDVNDRELSPPHRGEPCALLNPEPRAVTDSIFCLALALGTRKAGRFRVPLCLAEGFTS